MKKPPINHPKLGGDVVNLRKPVPQRKNHKSMSVDEVWSKAKDSMKK